jgi:radical SAM superfamily enzyme YgiQ (UPF0313 family)
MFDMLPTVILAVQRIKELYPQKTFVLGGSGPSAVADEIIKAFPWIDVIVRGEGEHTLTQLLQNLETSHRDMGKVRGIVFRDDTGTFCATPQQDLISNLDDLPLPAYHLLDLEKYDVASILSIRGCPYHCTFCDISPYWGHRARYRSIESVMREVELLYQEFGKRHLNIVDDTFVLSKDRVLQLCSQLQKKKLDIHWSCLGRVDLMDDEILREMSMSGCHAIGYGLESGSDIVLRRLRKGFSLDRAISVICRSARYFESIKLFLMWGYPFETLLDFKQTLFSLFYIFQRSPVPSCNIICGWNHLIPMANSSMYRCYEGRLIFDDLCNTLRVTICSDGSTSTLREGNPEIYQLVRDNPNVFPNFWRYPDSYIEEKWAILSSDIR